jgi:hypothetical protein
MQKFSDCIYNGQNSITTIQAIKINLMHKHICFSVWVIYKLFFQIARLGGVTLWDLQKFLQYINYVILPSFPPHPISGIVSTDIIFPFTYIHTWSI